MVLATLLVPVTLASLLLIFGVVKVGTYQRNYSSCLKISLSHLNYFLLFFSVRVLYNVLAYFFL